MRINLYTAVVMVALLSFGISKVYGQSDDQLEGEYMLHVLVPCVQHGIDRVEDAPWREFGVSREEFILGVVSLMAADVDLDTIRRLVRGSSTSQRREIYRQTLQNLIREGHCD